MDGEKHQNITTDSFRVFASGFWGVSQKNPGKSRLLNIDENDMFLMINVLCLSISQTNHWKRWTAWSKSSKFLKWQLKYPAPQKRQASYVATVKQDLFQAMNVSFFGGDPNMWVDLYFLNHQQAGLLILRSTCLQLAFLVPLPPLEN